MLLILAIATLIWQKKYLKSALLVALSVGYWVIIMVSAPQDTRFYTENMLLPLGFIAAIPLVVDIVPRYRSNYILLIFAVLSICRFGFIYAAHTDYTRRFEVYEPYYSVIRAKNLNGMFVDEKLIDQRKAIATWGSGYESILLSSLRSPDSCMIVQFDSDPLHYNYALEFDTSMVTIYGVWGKSCLPARYFKLKGGKYEIVKTTIK
jgi:hypothetical protein